MPYNADVKTAWRRTISLLGALVLSASGCVTELPPLASPDHVRDSLIVGQAVTVLTGEKSRRYLPQVRFLEVENQNLQQRFRIELNSPDQFFVVDVPPGTYRLTRVQISEGPFLSMADLSTEFSVGNGAITHVGTWRFGVGSPRYGRELLFSVTVDPAERERLRAFLKERYEQYSDRSMEENLARPAQEEARLYEVMPYPRYSEYFRRHWW